jgi:hypothetical protein
VSAHRRLLHGQAREHAIAFTKQPSAARLPTHPRVSSSHNTAPISCRTSTTAPAPAPTLTTAGATATSPSTFCSHRDHWDRWPGAAAGPLTSRPAARAAAAASAGARAARAAPGREHAWRVRVAGEKRSRRVLAKLPGPSPRGRRGRRGASAASQAPQAWPGKHPGPDAPKGAASEHAAEAD